MTAENLTGVRWSGAVVCKRRALYQHLGAPTRDFPQHTERLWKVRRVQNDAIVAEFAAELRAEGHEVILEMDTPWACGTAHPDLIDRTEGAVWEVTGTQGAALDRRKVLQVVGYIVFLDRFWPLPDERKWLGAVHAFDPLTGDIRDYPIELDDAYHEVVKIEDDVVDAIEHCEEEGYEFPERVCRTERDGPAMFCEMRDYCFRDFVEPEADVIEDEEIVRVVAELAAAQDRQSLTKKDLEIAAKETKRLQREVSILLPSGRKFKAGDVEISIVDIDSQPNLQFAALAAAGRELPFDLTPFVTWSNPYQRFYTKSGV